MGDIALQFEQTSLCLCFEDRQLIKNRLLYERYQFYKMG